MGPWKFGPKWALFGPRGDPEGTQYQVKVGGDHESNPGSQWGAVRTKSGPPGPSEDLRGPRKDLLWPKWALFASF